MQWVCHLRTLLLSNSPCSSNELLTQFSFILTVCIPWLTHEKTDEVKGVYRAAAAAAAAAASLEKMRSYMLTFLIHGSVHVCRHSSPMTFEMPLPPVSYAGVSVPTRLVAKLQKMHGCPPAGVCSVTQCRLN